MTLLGLDRRDLGLTLNLLKMMLRDRYLGSALGGAWAVLNPLLLLALFTFVFGFVFKSKLPGAETTLSYAIWLIAGYGPWISFTESVTAGATSVVSGTAIIKNLSMKPECLTFAATLTGVVSLCVAIVFLVILLVIDGRAVGWEVLALPAMVVLQFIFVTGIALFLASINVFVRDLSLVLPNLIIMVLFTSPIFYPVTVFPEAIRGIVSYSPFAVLVDGYRQPLVYNSLPNPERLAFFAGLSFALLFLGLRFFRRLKPYFDARL